jgi:hypothetical protein
MSVCYISGFVIQVGLSGLVNTLYRPCLREGLDFADHTWASDIGCDLSWFAMQRRDLKLFNLPLDYK